MVLMTREQTPIAHSADNTTHNVKWLCAELVTNTGPLSSSTGCNSSTAPASGAASETLCEIIVSCGLLARRGMSTGCTQINATRILMQAKRHIQQTMRGERKVHQRASVQAARSTSAPCQEARQRHCPHVSDQDALALNRSFMAFPSAHAIRCV